MKDAHDARYISKKHVQNIIFIPAEGLIDFGITEERKKHLFDLGKERAQEFLKTWGY
jgi:NTE family protein